jgi:hypothetical protein
MPRHQRRPARPPAPGQSWVTQADRGRWQQQAAGELSAILAAHPDLPTISWTITPGGGLTGQALVPGDPRGSRELFNSWRQALELHDVQETTMGDGSDYVRARASRGTIRVTLTAVVARLDATDKPGRRSPRPVQAAGASRPAIDATPTPPWARPTPPPGLAGQSPA